jgi:hormone-sensitive lipase
VIIAGDSAGGNMGLGICLRALRTGVPLPDGLLLSYPALNLDLGAFTPSLL